jgi:sugar lactone lactonase YvrE
MRIEMTTVVVFILLVQGLAEAEDLFQATPVPVAGFTAGIEGPACDGVGNLYAVAYQKPENIARITPDGKAEVFVTLPNKSCGNGIIFDRAGRMYVADYVNQNVLAIDPKTRNVSVLVHEPKMHQPNDLAIADDGVIYASDPDWDNSRGQIWRITPDGTISLFADDLGTANGIEVSPDGKTLYVNESVQRNIWAYDLTAAAPAKRLVKQFDEHGLDGMRCDAGGNLYVARFGKGTVVKLSPSGETLEEIGVLGSKPSNVCLGGPDGRTVYVTEMEKQRLVSFRTDKPGSAWSRWHHR